MAGGARLIGRVSTGVHRGTLGRGTSHRIACTDE